MIQKDSSIPIYQQVLLHIRDEIASGSYPIGSRLPTEGDWCDLLSVSRYPLRQAMATLEREGIIARVRGKGTYVRQNISKVSDIHNKKKVIALILPNIGSEYATDIVRGFISAASKLDFVVIIGMGDNNITVCDTIKRAVNAGSKGIVLFPQINDIKQIVNDLIDKKIYVSLIDRNPGYDNIDFITSDNVSGGYLVARHMHLQGYTHVAFAANSLEFSAVQDRLNGFMRGLKHYNMTLLNSLIQNIKGPIELRKTSRFDYSTDTFMKQLDVALDYVPFGLFCENDNTAMYIMDLLYERGIKPGHDIGVIGFDNISASKFYQPSLTTVSQNGFLIGETAAETAISRIVSGSKRSIQHMLPTHIITRKSCGELRNR